MLSEDLNLLSQCSPVETTAGAGPLFYMSNYFENLNI